MSILIKQLDRQVLKVYNLVMLDTTNIVISVNQRAVCDFVDAGSGHLVINAVAGSGKTTTLKLIVSRLPLYIRRYTLILAFNVHIKEELAQKMRDAGIDGVRVMTSNGYGYGTLMSYMRQTRRNVPNEWVDPYREKKQVQHWIAINSYLPQEPEFIDFAIKSVLACKQSLVDPKTASGRDYLLERFAVEPGKDAVSFWKAVCDVLSWSVSGAPVPNSNGNRFSMEESISYADQLYLPIIMNLKFPEYRMVLVDEAQDLNRAQQEVAIRAAGRTGRIIAVGDRNQAIFGFAGADSESMETLKARLNAKELPLSVCYRCPRSVIRLAKDIVPSIRWAETAQEGTVASISEDTAYSKADRDSMVICRLTAPVVRFAFGLIRNGKRAYVRGTEIGKGFIRILDAIEKKYKVKSLEGFADSIAAWRDAKVSALPDDDSRERKTCDLFDQAETIQAVLEFSVADGAKTVSDLRATVTNLFSDKSSAICCSTVHRAKGLEAKTVFILRPDLMPLGRARQDWEKQQEENLRYVAYTRAMETLYLVDSKK